jgi:hypothetical protein
MRQYDPRQMILVGLTEYVPSKRRYPTTQRRRVLSLQKSDPQQHLPDKLTTQLP